MRVKSWRFENISMVFCLVHIPGYLPYMYVFTFFMFCLPVIFILEISNSSKKGNCQLIILTAASNSFVNSNFYSWNIKFFKKGNCQLIILTAASNSFVNLKFKESFTLIHLSQCSLIWFFPSGTFKRMHKLYFKFEIQRVFYCPVQFFTNSENHFNKVIWVIVYWFDFYLV